MNLFPIIVFVISALVFFCGFAFINGIIKKKISKWYLLILPVVLFLIIVIVVPPLLKTSAKVETSSSKAVLLSVQKGLELYYTHYKYYPENLEISIKAGYLGKYDDVDPFGNKLNYTPIYSADKTKVVDYMLLSNGPDGKPYTSDDIKAPMTVENHILKKK
ncbi:MAG: hypothetical protein A2231_09660 [Candidatus Firestonebacteria bacterium RIFOXYA2_FULL_40_8]|nr:MAG: hypothetical protein A2231_09660 [Candidatus Firestonebacteria bacterium RIFOXYA2_FULL_40_8]